MFSPITKVQWKSVLTNVALAALAAFSGVLVAAGTLDKATLSAGATAAIMAIFKVVQKSLTTS